MNAATPPGPQMWGGPECSMVRVGQDMRDQFADTGHTLRAVRDLEACAALGLRVLRYPVSWERVSPDHPDECDWAWHDAQLDAMRRMGIRPILGLVHHGGGPRRTSLADPHFATRLAEFAGQVARRYPWVTDWTPVNEPVTTARFSGLYGHWYPHREDERAFLRILANECRAVVLSMQAIRAEIPAARLVQTEDLGKTFSRRGMRAQAAYDNARRWLGFDLLLGRIAPRSFWHARMVAAGVPPAWLAEFRRAPIGPMMLGFNHYVTSERFLDDRLALYPRNLHGGNGRVRYVDTEALRVPMPAGSTGWLPRMREAMDRYPGLPAAVTEVHLGCEDPAHQIRWLAECWEAARTLHAQGYPVEGVTAWSLFGAVDWCSLLTERRGRYEPGVFDVSSGTPRPTPLAAAVAACARGGAFEHEALSAPGWWRHPGRLHPGLVIPAAAPR